MSIPKGDEVQTQAQSAGGAPSAVPAPCPSGDVPKEGSRDIQQKGKIISVPHDWCKSTDSPVPYKIWAWQSSSSNLANTVRQTDCGSHVLGSTVNQCYGDEPGTGGGVKSGTNLAECTPLSASPTVRAQDRPMVRYLDKWWMNHKNTWGCLNNSEDMGTYDTPKLQNIDQKMVAQAATGTMNDAAPAAGSGTSAAPSIPNPSAGIAPLSKVGVIGTASQALQEATQAAANSQVQGAAQRFGLDTSTPGGLSAAQAYVWGTYNTPGMNWDVPFSGQLNDSASQAVMQTELASPGTLAGAQHGNQADIDKLNNAVAQAVAHSKSQTKGQAKTSGIVRTTQPNPKSDCENLRDEIHDQMYGTKGQGSDNKGLFQRQSEQISGAFGPGQTQIGSRVVGGVTVFRNIIPWNTHSDQIAGLQNSIRNKLKEYNKKNCHNDPNAKINFDDVDRVLGKDFNPSPGEWKGRP